MRLDELRRFMAELVDRTSLREAADLVGLNHEALRKFVRGITLRPHERTRRAMARLFLEDRRVSAAERESAPTAGRLTLHLPRGEGPAGEAVRSLFDALRATGVRHEAAAAVEAWLLRRVREEYAADPQWRRRAPSRRTPPDA